MFRPLRSILLLALLLTFMLRGEPSLESAHRARAMLGPEVWSQVITVRNASRDGVYPRIVHALVFELADILWFYTDVNGTQSFSLHVGQLEREKADFAPLLRDIDPGFGDWSVVEERSEAMSLGEAPLRNGCFIESVVAARERQARGLGIEEPRLLSYHVATRSGKMGHTVLAYDVAGHVEIFDSARPAQTFVFAKQFGRQPLALARALEGGAVLKARYVPLPRAGRAKDVVAASGDDRDAARARAAN